MVKKNTVQKSKKGKRTAQKKRPFFVFNKTKYTQGAIRYHNEIAKVTNALISNYIRINRVHALCKRNIEILKKGNNYYFTEEHFADFIDLQYHLENFCFRFGAYKDKLAHFVNQALRLGFLDWEMALAEKIKNNGIAKKAHLDTEFKKFNQNKSLAWALKKRKILAHRLHYDTKDTGYHPLMIPQNSSNISRNAFLKEWRSNLESDVRQAERVVQQAIKMNDLIMGKINKHLNI